MFGKAKRRDAEAMESIREQLAAADMHARSVLSAVAQTESRWAKDREDRSQLQLSAEKAIENVRSSVVENAADVAKTLQQVTAMCALVVERLEADTIERRALTDAITTLSRQAAVAPAAPVDTPSRIHGGTVLSSPASSNGNGSNGNGSNGNGSNGNGSNADASNVDIDLTAYETAARAGASVEEAPRTIERFRPFATPPVASESVQVLEPIEVDAVEVVDTIDTIETIEVVEAIPYVAPEPAVPEPLAHVAPETTPAPPFAEPVAPAKPFDAFAGLPLLAPKPTTPPVEIARPVEDVAPAAPFGVVPTGPTVQTPAPAPTPTPFAAVAPTPGPAPAPAAPAVSDGLEREWTASYQLTENNTYRPHGGTRLTPRRSNVRTPSN
jgi:hypothetical protein